MKKRTSTYSMWSTFTNCQRRAYWRYVKELVPILTDPALMFGTLIHNCLAEWYKTGSAAVVMATIDANYPDRHFNPEQRKYWHYATAMMTAYIRRHLASDPWTIVGIEQEFTTKLTNPKTGWSSHSFCLRGKVDMMIEHNNKLFVVEHKTTSSIDAAYIEALQLSLQSDIYSFAIGDAKKAPVGVIYNLLQKPALRQYEVNQRRKEAETDVDFQARLLEALSAPECFQRLTFYYDATDRRRLQAELWELSKRWLHCERTRTWLQNRGACFKFRTPCPYFKLCSTRDDEGVLNEYYEHKAAHSELSKPQEGNH